jgi:DNA-binding Lrp family transcriptional regulator
VHLSDQERKILAYVEMAADTPVAKVASELGYRFHKVRYCIEKLRCRQIIVRRAFIDTQRLGYMNYLLRFSINVDQPGLIPRLISALKVSDKVSWLIELGGEYQFEIRLTVRTVNELNVFLEWLGKEFRDAIRAKDIVTLTGYTVFGTRMVLGRTGLQFAPKLFKRPPTCSVTSNAIYDLDEVDHRILQALCTNALENEAGLASHLKLPPSTLAHRLRRLEHAGIIATYCYTISGGSIGINYYLALIATRGLDPELYNEIFAFCRDCLTVRSLIRCVGSWDIEVRFAVEHHDDVTESLHELNRRFSKRISKVEVIPYFTLHKIADYPFNTLYEQAVLTSQSKKVGNL